MINSRFLIFYILVCNFSFISTIIYSCNRTADCGCSSSNANVHKIVGGENAYPSSWGWAVSLQLEFGGHFCTGSVVSPLHIITAAHCFAGEDEEIINRVEVVVGIDRLSDSQSGSPYVQIRSINRTFIHPNYNAQTIANDIAVLRLNESLIFSTEMPTARICLPRVEPLDKVANYPADSVSLVAIGWGKLNSEATSIPYNLYLQQVTLNAVPLNDETCKEFINDSRVQFCAAVRGGGKDACQGDSGGPLMRFEPKQKQWILAGVTSFGLGCGDPRFSGVFTRVSAFRDWLHSIINDGVIESLADPSYSDASKNYYNIYFVLLLIVQLCFIFL